MAVHTRKEGLLISSYMLLSFSFLGLFKLKCAFQILLPLCCALIVCFAMPLPFVCCCRSAFPPFPENSCRICRWWSSTATRVSSPWSWVCSSYFLAKLRKVTVRIPRNTGLSSSVCFMEQKRTLSPFAFCLTILIFKLFFSFLKPYNTEVVCVSDLKMENLMIGIGGHSSTFPSIRSLWSRNQLKSQENVPRTLENLKNDLVKKSSTPMERHNVQVSPVSFVTAHP